MTPMDINNLYAIWNFMQTRSLSQETKDNDNKQLDQVLEEIETQLKDYRCPLELSVPLIPVKAKALNMHDRLFTHDNFETRALLKSLARKRQNPVNREPLYVDDIGHLLTINYELINKVDDILKKNGFTRKDLLNHYGISQDLYDYLIDTKFSQKKTVKIQRKKPRSAQALRRESNLDNIQFIEIMKGAFHLTKPFIALYLLYLAVSTLVETKPGIEDLNRWLAETQKILALIAKTMSLVMDVTMKNGKLLTWQAVEFFKGLDYHYIGQEVFSTLALGAKNVGRVLVKPEFHVPTLITGATMYTVSTTYSAIKNRTSYASENSFKNFILLMSALCILFLGLDAMTDSLNLIPYLSPAKNLNSTIGMAPIAAVALAGLFGKTCQKSKGEIAYEEFKRNHYEYKKLT